MASFTQLLQHIAFDKLFVPSVIKHVIYLSIEAISLIGRSFRADKANCGRCGNTLAMKLDNKLEYQFKITKQVSGREVLERMRKHTGQSMRRLL